MFCNDCGTSNPDAAKFCNQCGKSLLTVAPSSAWPSSANAPLSSTPVEPLPKPPQTAQARSATAINPLWPKIVDERSARFASGEGLLASLVAIGLTVEASHVLPSVAIWINVMLFAAIGIGCWFMMRAAPCFGLLLAFTNLLITMNASTEMSATKLAVALNGGMMLAYVNAIRGTFAYSRFVRRPNP